MRHCRKILGTVQAYTGLSRFPKSSVLNILEARKESEDKKKSKRLSTTGLSGGDNLIMK